MSFSQLRPNATIYILNKEGLPSVEVGTVVSVTTPMPLYGSTPMQQYPMQFGNPQQSVVDITARVQDKTGTFNKVAANAEVFDYNSNMLLSTSKEAINAELAIIRKRSVELLGSVEHNKEIIKRCDELKARLNPEIAEKQSQAQKIANLEKQMAELVAMNKELMTAISSKRGQVENKGVSKTDELCI